MDSGWGERRDKKSTESKKEKERRESKTNEEILSEVDRHFYNERGFERHTEIDREEKERER